MLIPGYLENPGFDIIKDLSMLNQWFTCVRLSDPYMPRFILAFNRNVHHRSLSNRSSLRLFETRSYPLGFEGPTFILDTAAHLFMCVRGTIVAQSWLNRGSIVAQSWLNHFSLRFRLGWLPVLRLNLALPLRLQGLGTGCWLDFTAQGFPAIFHKLTNDDRRSDVKWNAHELLARCVRSSHYNIILSYPAY